jgi:hypothetical protein
MALVEVHTNKVETQGKTFTETTITFNGVPVARIDIAGSNSREQVTVSQKVGKDTQNIDFRYNPKTDSYIGESVGKFSIGGRDISGYLAQEIDASGKDKEPTRVASKRKSSDSNKKEMGSEAKKLAKELSS